MRKLPVKLAKEPLIDVVFELRFDTEIPLSVILPAKLIATLPSNGPIPMERLPAADIAEQTRNADANLRFKPLVRLTWGSFRILISDRSLIVAASMPYPGWTAYKTAIETVLGVLKDDSLNLTIQRHSLKYVDVIERESLADQVNAINIDLQLGGFKLLDQNFQVKMELKDGSHAVLVQVVTSATARLKDKPRSGVIVDVDAIRVLALTTEQYLGCVNGMLDEIHDVNKKIFFSCLRSEALTSLEPVYE